MQNCAFPIAPFSTLLVLLSLGRVFFDLTELLCLLFISHTSAIRWFLPSLGSLNSDQEKLRIFEGILWPWHFMLRFKFKHSEESLQLVWKISLVFEKTWIFLSTPSYNKISLACAWEVRYSLLYVFVYFNLSHSKGLLPVTEL